MELPQLVIALIGALILTGGSGVQESYRTTLSGATVITEHWIELRPKRPLSADHTFQWVELELEPPLRNDLFNEGIGPHSGKGILMPDHEIVNPEIEVIDEQGNAYAFVYKGARDGPIYGYPQLDKLPRDRRYTMVRLRSSKPIRCNAIYWDCESSRDWH